MSDEKISIQVKDDVEVSIEHKLDGIARKAREGYDALELLKRGLRQIESRGLNQLVNSSSRLEQAIQQQTLASNRLAAEQQRLQAEVHKTNTAWLNSEAALTRAVVAESKAAVQSQQLSKSIQQTATAAATAATAQVRLQEATANSQMASQRLVTEQQRTAEGLARAATASQRLATEQERTEATRRRMLDASAESSKRLQIEQQKLATEVNRTNAAYLKSEAALSQAVVVETKAAVVGQQLAAAQQKTAAATAQAAVAQTNLQAAQANSATAAQKLATEQQRTAAAQAATATATQRLQTVTVQTATAQQQLAGATQRAAAAQTQGQTAAARLATEQARTAKEAANAAAASDRAALAALRLQQAQQRAANATQNAGQALLVYLRNAAALAGVGLGAGAVLSQADAYTTLQNKLRVIADSEEQVVELTTRLFDIANKTRTGIEATATSFARFDNALISLGKSQEDTLRLQETVNKLFVVGGATASEQSAALIQLSQAFNSNVLQGEEFRSLAENMPKQVRTAIADVLNVNESALKKLASEGKITGDVLFKAFMSLNAFADSKFANTVPTLGQSMVVLKNNFTQAIGEFDKALGITAALSGLILGLANNLDILGIAAVTTGGLMAVYYGPTLVAMFARARVAVLAFTAALAANPIGLLAVALSVAVTWFLTLEDSTLKAKQALIVFGGWLDKLLGYIRALIIFKTTAINELGSAVASGIMAAFNKVVGFIEDTINLAIEGSNALREKVGLEKWKPVDFSGLKAEGKTEFRTAGELWAEALEKGFKSQGNFFADALNFMNPAASGSSGPSTRGGLRGSGRPTVGPPPPSKEELSRQRALEKINDTLDAELARMFMLKDAREAQARLDQIQIQFASKHGQLTEAETNRMRERISVIQQASNVQSKFDEIAEASIGPLRDYNDTLAAAAKLRAQGTQFEEAAKRAVFGATEAYLNQLDPLRQVNNEIKEQNKLLLTLPQYLYAEQQVQQLVNAAKAKNIELTGAQIEQMKKEFQQQSELMALSQAVNNVYSETAGRHAELANQTDALAIAHDRGWISAQAYKRALTDIGVEQANLKLQFGDASWLDVFRSALGEVVSDFQNAMTSMSQMSANFFGQLTDGFANSVGRAIVYGEDLKSSFQDVARQGVAELISSLVKLGIQWLINAALGKSIQSASLATSTAMSVAAGAATAAAWAPAAAMVSLATLGGNVGPAALALTTATTLAEALATVSAAGLQKGGYTGNAPVNQVAGVVHGQEFVFDAPAVKRIGIGNLERMRSGAADVNRNAVASKSSARSGPNGQTSLNVSINNYGTPKAFEVQQLSESDIRIIARDEASKEIVDKTPKVVASEMQNPNSRISKAMGKSTDVHRRR